jgi:hypothetical protein
MSEIFFCKMCGRAARFNKKPNWCYFDRYDSIENVSDEDAVRMGIRIPQHSPYEFPGDVRWHPMTGEPSFSPGEGTLKEFQLKIMERV